MQVPACDAGVELCTCRLVVQRPAALVLVLSHLKCACAAVQRLAKQMASGAKTVVNTLKNMWPANPGGSSNAYDTDTHPVDQGGLVRVWWGHAQQDLQGHVPRHACPDWQPCRPIPTPLHRFMGCPVGHLCRQWPWGATLA